MTAVLWDSFLACEKPSEDRPHVHEVTLSSALSFSGVDHFEGGQGKINQILILPLLSCFQGCLDHYYYIHDLEFVYLQRDRCVHAVWSANNGQAKHKKLHERYHCSAIHSGIRSLMHECLCAKEAQCGLLRTPAVEFRSLIWHCLAQTTHLL